MPAFYTLHIRLISPSPAPFIPWGTSYFVKYWGGCKPQCSRCQCYNGFGESYSTFSLAWFSFSGRNVHRSTFIGHPLSHTYQCSLHARGFLFEVDTMGTLGYREYSHYYYIVVVHPNWFHLFIWIRRYEYYNYGYTHSADSALKIPITAYTPNLYCSYLSTSKPYALYSQLLRLTTYPSWRSDTCIRIHY